MTVAGSGRHLLFHQSSRLMKLAEMRAFIEEAMGVFRTLSASTARVTGSVTPRPALPIVS